ncbi:unnamed protein product, partial [Owenia fusiformis]
TNMADGVEKSSNQNSETKSSESAPPREKTLYEETDKEDYGYYFYPDRKGGQETSTWRQILEGRGAARKLKCERNVMWCMDKHPMVRLMAGALKAHGCPVNLKRHVSCEKCKSKVNGGFDPKNNQVVVCHNNSTALGVCCSVLAHELTHAFDQCRAKANFEDVRHLACTEIRAANFNHCSFSAAWAEGDAAMFGERLKAAHQTCVKRKALSSVVLVRNIPVEEASKIVDSVFDKCYNDLEPVGRIPRKGSKDPVRALNEGYMYGYRS